MSAALLHTSPKAVSANDRIIRLNTRANRGLTVIELLIAAGLAVIVMAMGYMVFVSSDRSFRSGQEAISADADLRHAMDLVVQDVRHATSVSVSGTTVTVSIPASVASSDVTYIYSDSKLFRQQGPSSSVKLVAEDIIEFTITPTDGTTMVRMVSTRPRLQQDRELTSTVTLRNRS